MSKNYQQINNLQVSNVLLKFVNEELLENTGIGPEKFWSGFDKSVHELSTKNKELLKIREDLQKRLTTGIPKIKEMMFKLMNIKNF